MHICDAIRKIFWNFRLPEDPAIGNIMEYFGKTYFENNKQLFSDSKSCANFAFSIFLICYQEKGLKKQVPLTLQKFIENNKGVNNKKNLPTSFLENCYERAIHFDLFDTKDKFIPVAKTGWLSKQGVDFFKLWKKRWFICTDGALSYFKKPGEAVLGTIYLENVHAGKESRKNTFRLHSKIKGKPLKEANSKSGSRDFCSLSADSTEDMQEWLQMIRANSYDVKIRKKLKT